MSRPLAGPADADNFRVEVGRYGDRWYTDPLPECHIATASDEVWPSVSTVKKASGSDWTFVGLKRVAKRLEAKPDILDGLNYEERLEALGAINKSGLKNAAARGTGVHLMAEDLLHGRAPVVLPGDAGAEYLPALKDFFDTYRPRLVAAEVVAVHRDLNGAGYAGTFDALVEISGVGNVPDGRYLLDYKSRDSESKHGAYAEEAAQISAYAGAQYVIVEGPNGPVRRRIKDLRGALILSVKPDGVRPYPIDIDKGFKHWTALHAWWIARRSEKDSIGRPLAAARRAA